MRKMIFGVCVLLSVTTVLQAKVKLIEAKIEPATASIGETVKATVEFSGNVKKISKVMLIPREYAYEIDQPFYLQADPTGANVWSLEAQIPDEDVSGKVNLEIKAYDNKDKEIVIKKFKDQLHGKAGLIELEIE